MITSSGISQLQHSQISLKMPSYLRNQTSFSTQSVYPTIQPTSTISPAKKQRMSITQAYYLAQSARGKLSNEASRADHDLRLLVGHANLLDSLMLELADAEREQESWFNQTVNGAAKASAEPKHIMWADTIPEEVDEDMESDSSDSDSEYDEDEEMDVIAAPSPMPARRAPSPPAFVTTLEVDSDSDDDFSDDGIEDYSELALTRTSSQHPPELSHESDSDSEDDSMPPSPPQTEAPLDAFSEKQRQAIATTSYYEKQASSPNSLSNSEQTSFFEEGFYLPRRQQSSSQQAAMISAY